MNFSLKTLSSDDINHYLGNFPKFGGVFSCRHLPRIDQKVYIVNMDINPNGPGTHWTMISNLNASKIIYFDPFGLPPNTYTDHWTRTSGKELYYSNLDYQNLDSHACGFYCIYVAEQLMKGRQMKDIIRDFTKNTISNERILEHYFIM